MKMVMVGGHTRNIGKTSVVEGIIRATAELKWTAIKITQFGHGVCSGDCETCDCAVDVDQFAITEENAGKSGSDTARFLSAGARRSLWLRTKQGELYTALPALKNKLDGDEFVIVESNSLRRFVKPAVYLQVVDPSNPDFKLSARQFFELSDGYVLVDNVSQQTAQPSSAALLLQKVINKPSFRVREQERFINDTVIEFIISRLNQDSDRW
jgi:molybdopterin-guanine dinucleotide biosynthesis protein